MRTGLPLPVILATAICVSTLGDLAPGVKAQTGPEDFLRVKRFTGTLRIDVSGSGVAPNGVRYEIDRRLNLSFALTRQGPVSPFGFWVGCVEPGSARVRDTVEFPVNEQGCRVTVQTLADGPVTVPQLPGAPIRDECPEVTFHIFTIPQLMTGLGFPDLVDAESITTVVAETAACAAEEFRERAVISALGEIPSVPDCAPVPLCVRLPDRGLEIRQHWNFKGLAPTAGGFRFPANYQVQIRLSGEVQELELLVDIEGYDDWRPKGGKDEDDFLSGNALVATATLRARDGGPPGQKAVRMEFTLTEVSNQPGVCLNWPPEAHPDLESLPPKPDLQFRLENQTPPAGGAWLDLGVESPLALHTDLGKYEKVEARITPFDWGAWGVLEVTAELEDGTVLVGRLASERSRTRILIPKRGNASLIADVWKEEHEVESLSDRHDGEDDPPGDLEEYFHSGDGLTLYEEYRGFYAGDELEHVHGDPKKKDLFIVNLLGDQRGVAHFARLSGLRVHPFLTALQLDDKGVVNFNHAGEAPHAVDQHGLVLEHGPLPPGVAGRVAAGPGTPGEVLKIVIQGFVNQVRRRPAPWDFVAPDGGFDLESFLQRDSTVEHELFHAVNVWHHGDQDRREVLWTVALDDDGEEVYVEGTDKKPVKVFSASGKAIVPARDVGDTRKVYIGMPGGEHSGDIACVMTYKSAGFYPDASQPCVYHLFPGPRESSFGLCDTPKGTGYNAPGPLPSFFGDATFGACARQICVNDRHMKKHDERCKCLCADVEVPRCRDSCQ